MAKKSKKNENITLEEKLEQALIPNWDEPYNLPNNWCWTYWGNCGQFVAGGAFKEKYQGQKGLPIPFYKVGSLKYSDGFGYLYDDTNTIDEETRNKLKVSLIPVNSIIFAKIGEAIRLNRRSLNELPCCIDNNLMAFIPDDKCYYKYVYYWSKSVDLYGYANATTVPAIRKTDLEMIPLPLAPYESQVKIVGRIENIFARLDEAKEKAQEVIDGFDNRKAAILHKAFSGELTSKWRKENGISFDEWNSKLFDECIEKMQNGLAKRKGSTGIPYVVLRLANLSDDGFITDDLREIMLNEKEQKSYKLNVGDVVMIRVNGSKDNVAKQILVAENNLWAFCDHIIRIKYNESVLPEYMVLYSKSEAYKIYVKDNLVSSAGQNTISRKGMARLSIPVPSIEEQKEIVNILSNMFDKERRVKETAEGVIEQIDTIKKSILARAFRGKLGSNDPTEESAVDLLKNILEAESSKKEEKVVPVRLTIPKEISEQLSTELEKKIVTCIIKNNGSTSFDEILAVSSKKFDVLETVRKLERKKLIFRKESGEYTLKG